MPEKTIRYLRYKLAAEALAEKWNNHALWDNYMNYTPAQREIARIDLNDITRAFWMIEKLSKMNANTERRPTIISRLDMKNMMPTVKE